MNHRGQIARLADNRARTPRVGARGRGVLAVVVATVGVSGFLAAAAIEAAAATPNDYLCAVSGLIQSAALGATFADPLAVELSSTSCASPTPDTSAGLSVTFAVSTTAGGASAALLSGGTVTVSGGVASEVATADEVPGVYEITATSTATTSNATPQLVTFTLTNTGTPSDTLVAGVGDFQTTSLDSPFPLNLAVTVTDANGNPVVGAAVTFNAPTNGPSGTFTTTGSTTATVLTDSAGAAVAPSFVADATPGGYVVDATFAGAVSGVAFALVNEATSAVATTSVTPSLLARGTKDERVTITGSGFSNGATVTFSTRGLIASDVIVVSSTTVTATLSVARDASVGASTVTVTDPNGASASGVDAVTVTPATLSSAGDLTLGFAPGSATLGGGARAAIRAYAKKLSVGVALECVGYAHDDVALARARVTRVAVFLESLVRGLHVVRGVTTSRTVNEVRIDTVVN